MKKLMFAAALAAIGTAFAVESGNVVGYVTLPLSDTTDKGIYYMSGCQFKDVGGELDSAKVTDLVKLINVMPGTYKTRNTAAPQIQVWTGAGYTKYFYISDANLTAGGTGTAWAPNRNEATDSISLGKGFWLYTPQGSVSGTAAATFAGEVKTDASSKTIDIGGSAYVMVANPFPVNLTFDKLTTTGITPGTYKTRNTDAPQIQVWTGAGYTKYFYISDANLTAGGTGTAWAPNRNEATGTIVAPGAGFWVKSDTAGSMTISM